MLPRLVEALQGIGLNATPEDIADILWLASFIDPPIASDRKEEMPESPSQGLTTNYPSLSTPSAPSTSPSTVESPIPTNRRMALHTYSNKGANQKSNFLGMRFRAPAATPLPGRLEIGRALRPLSRRVSSRTHWTLDEEVTAQRIAEGHIWWPAFRPALARWLDVALVIDQSPSMVIWRDTVVAFRQVLEQQGAFRDVKVWHLTHDHLGKLHLHVGQSTIERGPLQLVDPTGQRLILVLSDCVSPFWRENAIENLLSQWGKRNLVTIVQMLPFRLWARSGLGDATSVHVQTNQTQVSNTHLKVQSLFAWLEELPQGIPFPVVTLEPRSLLPWAIDISSSKSSGVPGFVFGMSGENPPTSNDIQNLPTTSESLVQAFYATASPMAQKLARYLAAAPLTVEVMRLVQQAMLPESQQVHLAEVFLSGLIKRQTPDQTPADPDFVHYDFVEGVRELLIGTLRMSETVDVLASVSNFVDRHTGQSIDFRVLIADPSILEKIAFDAESQPFATIAAKVLRRLGGRYADVASRLEQTNQQSLVNINKPAEPLSNNDVAGAESSTRLEKKPEGKKKRPANPYIAGSPIQSGRSFFDRVDILEWVKRELRESGSNVLVLRGQRRIGKTTLLLQFKHSLPADEFLPVFFDLQAQTYQPLKNILVALAEEMAKASGLSPKGKRKSRPVLPRTDNNERIFRQEFLPEFIETVHPRRPVILLDEFDVLEDDVVATALFPYFSELITDYPQLAFVTATGRDPADLAKDYGIIFRGALTKEVWVLDTESANALVRQAEANNTLSFIQEAVDRILALTHCHPFLTQLLCQRIWQLAYYGPQSKKVKLPTITVDDVNAALDDALTTGEMQLAWFWGGLSPAEKVYTAALAEISVEGKSIPEDEVVEVLARHAERFRSYDVEKIAPQYLVKRNILEKTGEREYRFVIEFIRRWVHENRSLQTVKDELDRSNEPAEQLFLLGKAFFERHQWADSRNEFERALKEKPDHIRSLIHLGETLIKLEEFEKAIQILEKAYTLDPEEARRTLARALANHAQDLHKKGDEEHALEVSERALQLSPQERNAKITKTAIWNRRGDEALERKDLDSALEAYQKAGNTEKIRGIQDSQKEERSERGNKDWAPQDNEEHPISTQDDESHRLIRYLRGFNYLYKKESDTVRSILVMINRYIQEQGDRRLVSHQDLAQRMIDYGIYQRVIEYAEVLIQDPDTLQKFMELIREETGEPREALVRDYMQNIPQGSIYSSKSTLGELIGFFRGAPSEVRYFLVVDDDTNVLKGTVSVNDFRLNIEQIRMTSRSTLVVNLPFYNGNPHSILDTDKMEFAANLFNETQQAGRIIIRLLVVNNNKRPVGFLAEHNIARWTVDGV